MEAFKLYVAVLSKAYGVLWKEMTHPRYAQARLDTYIRTPQALDEFLDEVEAKAGCEIRRVFYGNGSWAPSGRGREGAPVKAVLKRWELRFGSRLTMVDEYLTSQCCYVCGARTQRVACKDGKKKDVRGLMCCDSSTCSHKTHFGLVRGALRNRDKQGGTNVLTCGVAGKERPAHMTREGCGGKRQGRIFIRCDPPGHKRTAEAKMQCCAGRENHPS